MTRGPEQKREVRTMSVVPQARVLCLTAISCELQSVASPAYSSRFLTDTGNGFKVPQRVRLETERERAL